METKIKQKTYLGFKTFIELDEEVMYTSKPVELVKKAEWVYEEKDYFVINIPDNGTLIGQVIPSNAILVMGEGSVIKDCVIKGYIHAYICNSATIDSLTADVSFKVLCEHIDGTVQKLDHYPCLICESEYESVNLPDKITYITRMSSSYPKQPQVVRTKRIPFGTKEGYRTELEFVSV